MKKKLEYFTAEEIKKELEKRGLGIYPLDGFFMARFKLPVKKK